MKKIVLFVLLTSIIFSCKKDKTTRNNNIPIQPDPIGSVPSSFVKNILLENFTGEWNPNCPTGDDSVKAMVAIDTERVILASIHQGDWLAIPTFFTDISNHLGGVPGFPRAAINRKPAIVGTQIDSTVISIFNWRQNLLSSLADTAQCGLALTTTESKDVLTVKVYIGFNDSIKENTHLTIYIVENNLTAQNQINAPTPYTHQHVVRKIITSNIGDSVALFSKPLLTKEYTASIANAYEHKENLQIIAIVHTIGTTYKEHKVLNCQRVNLNTSKNWD